MTDRAVIFDMDGVLVDSYRAHFASWNRMLRPHGLEMSEKQFAESFGRTSREILREYYGDRVRPEDIAALDDEKEAAYREILREDFPEMDGASDLLRALREAGFRLAIGSSGPAENVDVVLHCLPGADRFEAWVHGGEVEKGKPAPEVFLRAAEKLGIAPGRCAVVEDAPAGVEAGKRAGMVVVALTGTATREDLAAADLVVDSLRELTPALFARLIDPMS